MTSVCSIAFNQKSDVVEFFIWGKVFFGGEGSFMGGDIEVFFGGGKVLGGKVQSPESRVQSPGSSPAFRICHNQGLGNNCYQPKPEAEADNSYLGYRKNLIQ